MRFLGDEIWYQDSQGAKEVFASKSLDCPSDDITRGNGSTSWPAQSYLLVRGSGPSDAPFGVAGMSFNYRPPLSAKITTLKESSRALLMTELHSSTNYAGGINGGAAVLYNPSWQYFTRCNTATAPDPPIERFPHGSRKGKIGDPWNTVNGVFNSGFVDGRAETLGSWETYNHNKYVQGGTAKRGMYCAR
jgi:hypothetical protein